MSAVIARAVSKTYGRARALDALDLDIARGEVFGLLGPNGSGKTTFIRLLAGYLLPTQGRLVIDGWDTANESRLARASIGYVPEAAPIYGNMRVHEFVAFMGRLRGVPARRLGNAVDRALHVLALDDVAGRPTRSLSRGYRQRVAIAQAVVHDPPIIVLDEPTNGLDPRQIIEIRELIRGLAGQHTVIMSSHILTEVARVADRVAILLGGKLLGVRSMAETPDLEDWFLSLT